MEVVGDALEVVVGVDTHLDVHVAVALDELGRREGYIYSDSRRYSAIFMNQPTEPIYTDYLAASAV